MQVVPSSVRRRPKNLLREVEKTVAGDRDFRRINENFCLPQPFHPPASGPASPCATSDGGGAFPKQICTHTRAAPCAMHKCPR